MRRRDVITLPGGVAIALPLGARAQQAQMPVIGFLSASSPGEVPRLAGFQQGLDQAGYVVGRNVAMEFRYAEGRYDRLPAMTREFVARQVAVIFASSLPSALAAKAATKTIPIVFASGADPVLLGLVDSLNRPGGNITGVSNYFGALGGKRLELLRELVPKAGLIAYLLNSNNQNAETHSSEVQAAARAMAQPIDILIARNEREIDAAFATVAERRAGALLVGDDPFYNTRRSQLIALAGRHAVPAIYYARDFIVEGGLISYGSSPNEQYRQAGLYVGRILKGEQPANLPVSQPTKFELIINLKTAKALGLAVPPTLLARADEVIE